MTHDLGTGPYELAIARVGSAYQLQSYDNYWGKRPYFSTVNIPVITDSSAEQLQFNSGSLAAILHDVPSSAVTSYLTNTKFATSSAVIGASRKRPSADSSTGIKY